MSHIFKVACVCGQTTEFVLRESDEAQIPAISEFVIRSVCPHCKHQNEARIFSVVEVDITTPVCLPRRRFMQKPEAA